MKYNINVVIDIYMYDTDIYVSTNTFDVTVIQIHVYILTHAHT